MAQTCAGCRREFAIYPIVDGVRVDLRGRKSCLECRPIRHLSRPRKKVERPRRQKTCESCGRPFAAKAIINGLLRSLYRRRFCLVCSPFGVHNTSKSPPRIAASDELREYRRRRRNAKTYRAQKRRRLRRKTELVAAAGGRCLDCGYQTSLATLEFHHLDPTTKEFGSANFDGSLERLLVEVKKCDLLCANCHRLRHLAMDLEEFNDATAERRRRKLRAVEHMGSTCFGCDRDGPPAVFEFHHWDARDKAFGLSQSGSPYSWDRVAAELEKCVMLCANCHREVHAGVRTIQPTLLGLAEDVLPYVA